MAKQLTKPETPPAPRRLTKKQLQAWDDLEEERLRLRREAAAVRREQEPIEAEFQRYVEANSQGKTRRVETCGYELAIEAKPKTPKWLALYQKLVGVAQVERDKEAAGTSDKLVIRKL